MVLLFSRSLCYLAKLRLKQRFFLYVAWRCSMWFLTKLLNFIASLTLVVILPTFYAYYRWLGSMSNFQGWESQQLLYLNFLLHLIFWNILAAYQITGYSLVWGTHFFCYKISFYSCVNYHLFKPFQQKFCWWSFNKSNCQISCWESCCKISF